jgi:hypothetical protein
VRAKQNNGRDSDGLGGDDVTPSVVGFLIDGGLDGALEGEIVREGGIAAHKWDGL